MPVSDQKILMKMMQEVEKAREAQHDPSKMKQHIRSVKMLTELFLEEEESTTNEVEVLKKMQEEQRVKSQPSYKTERQTSNLEHDGANGSSIFDF